MGFGSPARMLPDHGASVLVGVSVGVEIGVAVGVGVAGQGVVPSDAVAVLPSRCQTRAAPLELTLKAIG